jgi:hypothetical protein
MNTNGREEEKLWVIGKMEESTSSTVAVVFKHHAPALLIFPDSQIHSPAEITRL